MAVKTHNLKEFQQEAKKFALLLTPARSTATVVALFGDLGAGKTAFVQAVAVALGVTETVNSPTFLIMKKYKLKNRSDESSSGTKSYKLLYHIDAYRLKSGEDLKKIGFSELLGDDGNIIFIEWADKVSDVLPDDVKKIHFEFVDDSTRKIRFE